MAEPFYTCCEDGMLSQVPPTDRSGLCPACKLRQAAGDCPNCYDGGQCDECSAQVVVLPLRTVLPPCPGVDTRAEDYCAWKDEWDKWHRYAPAEGDAFDAGYHAAWKRASGVKGLDDAQQ